jgi:hypothetical protein
MAFQRHTWGKGGKRVKAVGRVYTLKAKTALRLHDRPGPTGLDSREAQAGSQNGDVGFHQHENDFNKGNQICQSHGRERRERVYAKI